MANLNNNINVTVAASVPLGAALNFGTPLHIAAAGTLGVGFSERIRYYNNADEAADDADLSAPAIAAVGEAFSQSPRTTTVAVGRVETDEAQQITFTFTGTPEVGDDLTITINGIETTYAAAGTVLDTEVTALRAALTTALAAEDVTVGGAAGVVTVTADNAGEPFTYSSGIVLDDAGDLAVAETVTQANLSIAEELSAIVAADDSWYGLAIASRDQTQIERVAAWTEARRKLFFSQTSDAAVLDATAGNVLAVLGGQSYTRTALVSRIANDDEYADLAALAKKLAADPDSQTTIWRYTTLAGITVEDYTATQINNVRNADGNVYASFKGTGVLDPGVTVNGSPIDILITRDWTAARIEERVADFLVERSNRNEKIPFTDAGIQSVVAVVQGVLEDGIEAGHFAEIVDPDTELRTPRASAPRASQVTSSDRANRLLRIEFVAQLAGAIELATITGAVVVDLS